MLDGGVCRHRRRSGTRNTQQIGEQRPVGFAGEEARQFAAQPVAEAFRELGVAGIFQSMQNERAEQDFSAGVVGAFLFSSASLQGLLLRVELGDAFGMLLRAMVKSFAAMFLGELPIAALFLPAKRLSQMSEFPTPEF